MAKIKVGLKAATKKAVAAAGTPERLIGASLEVKSAIILADPTNQGNVYLGESDVTGSKCVLLEPGKALEITPEDSLADEDGVVIDLNDIFIDAANNGDGVFISYLQVESVDYNSVG